jgi:Family of unknown function (DUF6281)
VAGASVVLLCTACASAHHSAVQRVPPCRAAITWHEKLYYPRAVLGLPARGASLGLAGVPSCTDVLGGETGASRAVAVSEFAGIDPGVAIAVFGDWDHAYVAAGHSLRLPGS